MSPVSSPGIAISNFFTSLFSHKPADSHILIWTLPHKSSHWFTDIAQAADAVERMEQTGNIYVQLTLSPKAYKDYHGQRCKTEDAIGFVGLHIDLDYGTRGHKKADKGLLPPDEETAYRILSAGPLPPTMVVNSGGGLWGHWLLDEPWIFSDAADKLAAQRLAELWNRYFQHLGALTAAEDRQDQPYAVDSVFDFARIARIPGTWNNKEGYDPVLATIVEHHDSYRYSKAELLRTIDALEWPIAPVFAAKHTNGHSNGKIAPATTTDAQAARIREYAATLSILERSPAVVQLPDKWQALCDNNNKVLEAWNDNRDSSAFNFLGIPVDNSTSGTQFVLALLAAWAEWTAQEIYDLILAYNVKSDPTDVKSHATLKYTVAKALLRVQDELIKRGTSDVPAPLTEEQKAAALNDISLALGIKVYGIKATVSSPRAYTIVTASGDTESAPIAYLQSADKVQGMIADATSHLIPLYNKVAWQNTLRKILQVVVDEHIGVENTLRGTITYYLKAYLETHNPSSEEDAPGTQVVISAKINGEPYMDGGTICLFLQPLRLYIGQKYQERITPPQLGRLLRAYGAVPIEEKNVRLPNSKKRSNFNFWRLPDDPRSRESDE